jgi:hypothetical protein
LLIKRLDLYRALLCLNGSVTGKSEKQAVYRTRILTEGNEADEEEKPTASQNNKRVNH